MPSFVFEFFQAAFDDGLGGDASVISTRHPEGFEASHTVPANADIL